eukprot:PhF_6_TR4936/c0_g1_i1/m.7000
MVRILVLHGWCNATEPCDFQMLEFKKIPGDLFLPQGPISVPEEDYVNFCRKNGVKEEVIAALSKMPHHAWWENKPAIIAPPQESPTTPAPPSRRTLVGLDEVTLPFILSYAAKVLPAGASFDAIVGFSQGAQFGLLLATLGHSRPGFEAFAVKKIVTVGGNHNRSAEYASLFEEAKLRIPCLILHGLEDKVVTKEESLTIPQHFVEGVCEMIDYPGGHHFPRDASTLEYFKAWVGK